MTYDREAVVATTELVDWIQWATTASWSQEHRHWLEIQKEMHFVAQCLSPPDPRVQPEPFAVSAINQSIKSSFNELNIFLNIKITCALFKVNLWYF